MDYLLDANEQTEWLIKSGKIDDFGRNRFILKNFQCPGDLLMLSACIRDIKRWYPHILLDVRTSCNDIWINNPLLTDLDQNDPSVFELDMQYEIIHKSNENIHAHFIHGFIDDFCKKTGFIVKLTEFKPDIYLTEEEKNTPVFKDQPDKFVVLVAGGKTDYRSKWWWKEGWTDIVKNCPEIQFIQVGKIDEDSHIHDVIEADNCINKTGKTSIRELLRLVYQSQGTLSVVTGVMHMAAAFGKHAAVIAGGHEPWWWEKYPGHNYFHTIGQFPCCRYGGCWKGECENKSERNRQRCLELIDPKKVANIIKKW